MTRTISAVLERNKMRIFSSTLIFLLILASCGGNEQNQFSNNPSNENKSSGFIVPTFLREKTLPSNGTISAFIVIDGGTRHNMSINGNVAEHSFSKLSLGDHVIEIIFEYSSATLGNNIEVARTTKTVTIGSGTNTLEVIESDYDTSMDSDGDSLTNLNEIVSGRAPLQAEKIVVDIPEAIYSVNQSESNPLQAFIIIDEGDKQAMRITNDSAEFDTSQLELGERTIDIIFEYRDQSMDNNIEIARANHVENIQGGAHSVVILDSDYDTSMDADGDSLSNLDEILSERAPLQAEKIIIAIPEIISSTTPLENGEFQAFIQIDGNEKQPLLIDNNSAEFNSSALSLGEQLIDIIFEYRSVEHEEPIEIARARVSLSVARGTNSINILSDDYDTSMDYDLDNLENIAEISTGRNAFEAERLFVTTPSLLDGYLLPENSTLQASISFNDDSPIPLTLGENEAEINLNNLDLGDHNYQIQFNINHDENTILLAETNGVFTLTAGRNSIIPTYSYYFDSDNDTVTNIDELLAGRNALIAESKLFATPNAISNSNLINDNGLIVSLSLNGGDAIPVSIQNSEISFNLTNTEEGTHTYQIQFHYESDEYDSPLPLAMASGEFDLSYSSLFSEGTIDPIYDTTYDLDYDGVSNLNEILLGRNANDAERVLFSLPLEILESNILEYGTLYSTIALNGAPQISLNIIGNQAEFLWGATPPGTYTYEIEIHYESPRFNSPIIVANSVGEITLETNTEEQFPTYSTDLDSDEDALSNLVEVLQGSNPFLSNTSDIAPPYIHRVFPPTNNGVSDGETLTARGIVCDKNITAPEESIAESCQPSENALAASGVQSVFSTGVQSDLERGIDFDIWELNLTFPLLSDNAAFTIEASDFNDNVATQTDLVAVNIKPFHFEWPTQIFYNHDTTDVVGIDARKKHIFAISTTTRDARVISSNEVHDGPTLEDPFDLEFDTDAMESEPRFQPRAVVTDVDGVVAVDLATGTRSLFSGGEIPDSLFPFPSRPMGIISDWYYGIVYVSAGKAIYAIDAVTGTRSIYSNNAIVSEVEFDSPTYMALDVYYERILVADGNRILAVSNQDQTRTVFSSNSGNSGPQITSIAGMHLAHPEDKLFITDNASNIISIDLATGDRTLHSAAIGIEPNLTDQHGRSSCGITGDLTHTTLFFIDCLDVDTLARVNIAAGVSGLERETIYTDQHPNQAVSTGKFQGLVYDAPADRLLTIDTTHQNFISIDTKTGDKSILEHGFLTYPTELPHHVTIDSSNRIIFFIDDVGFLQRLNLSTGENTQSSNGIETFNYPIQNISDIEFVDEERVIILDRDLHSIYLWDRNSGSLISSNEFPYTSTPFYTPRALELDASSDTLYVLNERSIIAVDVATGERTLITDNATAQSTSNVSLNSELLDLTADFKNNQLYILQKNSDISSAAIISVDILTGSRTLVSNGHTPNTNNTIESPKSIVFANDVLWVIDSIRGVIAIDPRNGERIVVAK